jgi:peptide/nickel transport system permease protein
VRNYAARRLFLFIPTLLFSSVVIFLLMRVAPGDTAAAILGDDATPERLAALRTELGLNRPLVVQYVDWLVGVVRLDLGNSLLYRGHKIGDLISDAMPITLNMTGWGILLMLAMALPIGILSAFRRDTPIEYVLRLVSIAGLSVPTFWLGIIVLFLMLRFLRWTPEFRYISFFDDPLGNFKAFVIPAAIFAYHYAAIIARMLRSQLLEVAREDYVRTATAKGLAEGVVARRHALPNAMLPVVTIIGAQVAQMLSGLIVVEHIFALPGLGTLMIQAAVNRDFIIVQSLTLVITAIVLAVNLVVDLLYGWLDPRVRLA